VLDASKARQGARLYRPTLFYAATRAIAGWARGATEEERVGVAKRIREALKFGSRIAGRRSVGSTLLLKGLEADVAVVLDAGNLDARNLYVAMTRGSRKLVICSKEPLIGAHA